MTLLSELTALAERARCYYAAFARRPYVRSNQRSAYDLFVSGYEAGSAAADLNEVFADLMVRAFPSNVSTTAAPVVPSVPRGVYWAVDKPTAGLVSMSIDVAGTITAFVKSPGTSTFVPITNVTINTTRNTLIFQATADGLYAVQLRIGTTPLATLYVPVMRSSWRKLRELSRHHGLGFAPVRPPVSREFTDCLSLLAMAEAAARTGRPELFYAMVSYINAIASSPSPVAISFHA